MQVKKNTTKKTYSSARKGFPKKKITLDELIAIQAKTETSINRLSDAQAKTEAAIDRLTAQNDRTAALVHELTRNMGGLNNSFGTLVEVVSYPNCAQP